MKGMHPHPPPKPLHRILVICAHTPYNKPSHLQGKHVWNGYLPPALHLCVLRSCLDAGGEWDELEATQKLRELVLRLRGGAADASLCEGDKGLEWRTGKGKGERKVPGLTWDGNVKGCELSIEGVASLKFRERSDEGEFEGAGDDLDSARSLCMILLPMCAALAP